MAMLTDSREAELMAYFHIIRLLFLFLGLLTLLLLHLTLSDIVGRWRQGRMSDLMLLTAGRNLENWVATAANRSASVHPAANGEWCITLRDPDLYLAGVSALQIYTSPTQRLPAAITTVLVQAQRAQEITAI